MRWRCALLQRWLPEYPDGNLPAFWRRWLSVHVESCPACRRELAELQEVCQALKAVPLPEPGQEFWQEFSREMHLKLVQAAQATSQPQRSRLPYWLGVPAAAAVAVLVLWIGTQTLDMRQTPGTLPGPQVAQKAEPPAPALEKPGLTSAPAPQVARKAEKSAAPLEKSGPGAPTPAPEVAKAKAPDQLLPVSLGTPKGLEENGVTDDDFTGWDDPESALSDLTPQEREILLNNLRLKAKDGSCVTVSSSVSWA